MSANTAVLFEYCDTHNKVPSRRTKYNNTNIGRWLSDQKMQNQCHNRQHLPEIGNEPTGQGMCRYIYGEQREEQIQSYTYV